MERKERESRRVRVTILNEIIRRIIRGCFTQQQSLNADDVSNNEIISVTKITCWCAQDVNTRSLLKASGKYKIRLMFSSIMSVTAVLIEKSFCGYARALVFLFFK